MFRKVFYGFTIFISAFLLFQIQPMIAKMILPWFGGAASVWITCMLFFQLVLLFGYIYAHWVINFLRPGGQIIVHCLFLSLSLLLLPVYPDQGLKIMQGVDPIVHLLIVLSASVGLPYFLLSTTSPLLQGWYARAYRQALPYRLFALSNLSSLLGLLAYPVLIEPFMTLSQQTSVWSWSYAAFVFACVTTALFGWQQRNASAHKAGVAISDRDEKASAPTARDNMIWLLLATCSSVMLLAATNYLTQNVASIPFLWILPLALYLVSFTLCFDRSGWYRRSWYVWLIAVSIGAMAFVIAQWGHNYDVFITIPLFCVGLFLCCMFCHGELAARKPAPGYLTGFYLMISVGGAAGGALVSIGAPKFLTGPFELSIALVACAALLFAVNFRKHIVTDIVCSALIVGTLWSAVYYIGTFTERAHLLVRDFYGTLKVDVINKGEKNEYRALVHGTITHGIQFADPARRNEHNSYYSRFSGLGMAVNSLQRGPRNVGVIGLGVGSISTYARKGDTFRFYEIDPLVEKVARREFTYLNDCKGKVDILIGDGRLLLERDTEQKFDLLVVDAFSSDSIPVHLLTVEALKLYFDRLKPDGIVAVHISNRNLNLTPVVELARAALGKKAVLISQRGDYDKEIYYTDWILLTSGRDLRKTREIGDAALSLESEPGLRLWTDDYSNLIQILKRLPD
jgi:spermidine synthase